MKNPLERDGRIFETKEGVKIGPLSIGVDEDNPIAHLGKHHP